MPPPDRRIFFPFGIVSALILFGCAVTPFLISDGTPFAAALAGGAILPLLGIAWLMIRFQVRWVAPVRGICNAAERMAAGDWKTRARAGGADDLRAAATTLNAVAAAAQKQLADLDARRGDLQTLVDALPDPILVADAQHRITLINAPAAALLEVSSQQAMTRRLSSIISDEAILGLLDPIERLPADKAPADDQTDVPRHREIRLFRNGQRGTYQAVASQTKTGGLLLVLRDVSTLAGAAQMKTDFVANASHELRTPIAAIKIAFETLQDVYREDPEQTEKCLTIIDGHLRRLEEMLRDLLDLSRVESPGLAPSLATVKIEELFGQIRSSMSPMARQKLVELAFGEAVAGPVPESFDSDWRLLNLILKNLVENSIKFTPAGGRVSVDLITSGDDIILTVADAGIGIPPEHMERVFERFYQVDSARSGSAGRGTGLGLAIVKHAVHALGGTVELQSTVGVGTTVTCKLPQTSATIAPA